MATTKSNSAELLFNFHRRFLRGDTQDEGHAKKYIAILAKDDAGVVADWENRPFIYSSGWIKETSLIPGQGDNGVVSQYYSQPLSKTSQFGDFFKQAVRENVLPFPFGFVDFDLFNGFKCANNVSGRIIISFNDDHFLLEGDFVTLPPARLESFNPTRKIYSNEDIKKVVAEFSDVFRAAADLKE